MKSDQIQDFVQSGLKTLQWQRLHSHSGQLFHCLVVLIGKKMSCYSQYEPLLFQLMLIVCHHPAVHSELKGTDGIEYPTTLGRAYLYLLVSRLIGTGRLLFGPLKTFSSPGWISPSSSVSAHGVSAPAPNHLGGPVLHLLPFINIFPVLWGPKWNNVL